MIWVRGVAPERSAGWGVDGFALVGMYEWCPSQHRAGLGSPAVCVSTPLQCCLGLELTLQQERDAELALLVYVDDLLWLTREKGGIEKIVVSIFLLIVLGLPFTWKKFSGGLFGMGWFQHRFEALCAGFVTCESELGRRMAAKLCGVRASAYHRYECSFRQIVLCFDSTEPPTTISGPNLRMGGSIAEHAHIPIAKGHQAHHVVSGKSFGRTWAVGPCPCWHTAARSF